MRYYSSPDGALHWRGQDGPIPPDWTLISKAAYDAGLAKFATTLARQLAQIEASEQAAAEQDHAALIAAGIPPRVAARLMRGAGPVG